MPCSSDISSKKHLSKRKGIGMAKEENEMTAFEYLLIISTINHKLNEIKLSGNASKGWQKTAAIDPWEFSVPYMSRLCTYDLL